VSKVFLAPYVPDKVRNKEIGVAIVDSAAIDTGVHVYTPSNLYFCILWVKT